MRCEEVRQRFAEDGIGHRLDASAAQAPGAAHRLVCRVPGRIRRRRGPVEGAWRRAGAGCSLEPDARAVLCHVGSGTRVRGPAARIPPGPRTHLAADVLARRAARADGPGGLAPDCGRPRRPRASGATGAAGSSGIHRDRGGPDRTPRHAADAHALADAAAVGDRAAAGRELDRANRPAGRSRSCRRCSTRCCTTRTSTCDLRPRTRCVGSAIAPTCGWGTPRAITDKTSPLLQVAVIDFMVDTRDPQAPALFRTLAQDGSLDDQVRGRAQWGLEQLAS